MTTPVAPPVRRPSASQVPGTLASRKVTFGPLSRYAVFAVHTRDLDADLAERRVDGVEWLVTDADVPNAWSEGPAVIRQAETFAEAVAGLTVDPDSDDPLQWASFPNVQL